MKNLRSFFIAVIVLSVATYPPGQSNAQEKIKKEKTVELNNLKDSLIKIRQFADSQYSINSVMFEELELKTVELKIEKKSKGLFGWLKRNKKDSIKK